MRPLKLLGAAAALAALALAVPSTAQAAQLGNTAVKAAPQTVIACVLNVQNPHNSTHNPENVNVVATFSCSAPTSSLSISVTLWKSFCDPQCQQEPYGSTGSAHNTNSRSISANSAGPCTSGDYVGVASAGLISPPGFVPPAATTAGQGNTVPITC
jgi:hypothetical protein